MAEPLKTIAVLVANPALSSILSMVLAAAPTLRVRPFDSELALVTYMRLAPVDLVVTDFDAEAARADRVVAGLRADREVVHPGFQVIALAGSVTPETKILCIHAGIDEVIVKPMSPNYLLERVLARLRRAAPAPVPPRRAVRPRPRDWSQYGNVVPLFPAGHPLPQH